MLTGREYIQKLYSELDENDLVSELLDRAFSERYEYAQREFARRDYEGLDEVQRLVLKKNRSKYAKNIRRIRNSLNKDDIKKGVINYGLDNIGSCEFDGNAGVYSPLKKKTMNTTFKVKTYKNEVDDVSSFVNRNYRNLRDSQLDMINDGKEFLRDRVAIGDEFGEVADLKKIQLN